MKNQTSYEKRFSTENEALDWMQMKNRTCRAAGNTSDIYCVVDGPENDFAVVDLSTAIELECSYQISY